jgi:hypothetical protein
MQDGKDVFEYGGYHFEPYRRFFKGEATRVIGRLQSDFRMGLFDCMRPPRDKGGYSREGFFAASTDKACDIFRCVENRRLYVPATYELFFYDEQK